jgi:hypothetical protein
MAITSVFTNIILFTYASDQIDYVIPALKLYKNDSAFAILTIFGIEHVLIVFIIVLRFVLDRDPAWVTTFFAR